MPSTSPSARTDCPSTASRGDGQQTRHERAASPAPCRRRARHAQHPGQMDTPPAAPMLPACPPRSNRQSQQEREDIRRGRRRARREKGRKDEDLRPLACRFAVKVIYRPNPAPKRPAQHRPSPAPPQASRHPSPHRLKLPVSRRTPARFCFCQFCFWRVCRTPAYFRPSADEQRHPARLPGRHRHRGSLHIFAPAPFLTKRLSTSTLSRTPHIPIFHSGTISTIPQQ